MVDQAEAITERHFLTISEPRIPELRSIARATNDMVRRLHNRAIEETLQLEALNRRMNHDPVTGLANRAHFMNLLREAVDGEDTVRGEAQEEEIAGEAPPEKAPWRKTAFSSSYASVILKKSTRNLAEIPPTACFARLAQSWTAFPPAYPIG